MTTCEKRVHIKRVVPALMLSASLLGTASTAWCNDEGRQLYLENCAGCHGKEGRGDGPAAEALPVKPADHTDGVAMRAHNDEYLFDIIAGGSMGLGRSPFMPAWGEQLSEQQINALVAYIRSLSTAPKE